MEQEREQAKSPGQVIRDAFNELGNTFVAFVKAPRALWGINVPYVLEGLVYFGILTILGKYCSENVNLSDLHAGWVYGGVTGGITFAMLLLGGVVDRIGVRLSMAISLGTMALGRLLIALSGTIPMPNGMGSPMFFTLIAGLFLMVVAYGLYQPGAYAGVKRYTNPQTAAMGYAVIYSLMNLGAFLSGAISSNTRPLFEKIFPPNGLTGVFWIYFGITVVACLSTILLITKRVDRQAVERIARETKEMDEKKGNVQESTPTRPHVKINNTPFFVLVALSLLGGWVLVLTLTDRVALPAFVGILALAVPLGAAGWEYLRRRPDHPFRDARFVFFIFILIPVQTLFAHNWLTIPYYLDRAFVGTWASDYFEMLSNLNPLIIFIITPIIAGLTARANVYRMMILGTFVMAAPTFLLAMGTVPVLFITYILIMSLGEAMWQPRFLQWVAEIAPEGKTGAYMGIGQFPWFLTKVLTSLYSGYFVATYIPKPDTGLEPRPEQMWLIYAAIAMISPVALFLAKNWMIKGKGMKKRGSH